MLMWQAHKRGQWRQGRWTWGPHCGLGRSRPTPSGLGLSASGICVPGHMCSSTWEQCQDRHPQGYKYRNEGKEEQDLLPLSVTVLIVLLRKCPYN